MLNKNMLLVSGVAVVSGAIGFGASEIVKGARKLADRKKKEKEFFNVLKECIEEETDYCINIGIIDESVREKVTEKIFKGTKEMMKDMDTTEVFNMSPDEQKKQLKEGLKNSRSAYAMYGLFA